MRTVPGAVLVAATLVWGVVACVPVVGIDAGPTADGGPGAGDAAAGDASTPDAAAQGPFASCAEIPADACFANPDCPADRLCRSVGASVGEVVCCVVGPRGEVAAGEPCDVEQGETQCASAICIEVNGTALCSKTCTSPADCPASMQRCMFIAFSESNDMWCFPE